jgi:hypothetical protein
VTQASEAAAIFSNSQASDVAAFAGGEAERRVNFSATPVTTMRPSILRQLGFAELSPNYGFVTIILHCNA